MGLDLGTKNVIIETRMRSGTVHKNGLGTRKGGEKPVYFDQCY